MNKVFKMKNLFFILLVNFLWAQKTMNLKECLDYALKHNPDIQQSILNIDKNQKNINIAKGKLLPLLNANASHSYSYGSVIDPQSNQRVAKNVQIDQLGINANVDLLNWKNYLEISLSKLNKESVEYRLKIIQNNKKIEVINLFFQYMKDKSWFDVLEPQISGMKEQISRTEKEVEIGNRPKSDVYDIKANFGTIQEQWISAQNQMNISKINLLASLNITKDSVEFVLEEVLAEEKLFSNSDELIERLVKNNPIYLENEKNLEAAKQRIKIEKADFLPTISGAYYWGTFYSKTLNSTGNISFSDQFSQNKNPQLSFGLNVPIFQRFQVKNMVELAKLDLLNTQFENEKNLNEIYKILNIIAEQYENALQKNEILTSNFENQKLSFERSEEKYKEGLIDAYNFFVVRNNWLQANFNLNSSKYEVMQQTELLKVFE